MSTIVKTIANARLAQISDSEYGRFRDMLSLPTTAEQDLACLLLERYGQRFLVDFGYENAEEKLAELREDERAEREFLLSD